MASRLILLTSAAVTLPTWAAGDAEKDRCAAYAKHAVEQYQIMKNHPGCDSHLDALSWRDDYAYHYNGCMTFGKIATTLSDQGRDGHLRACGAIASDGSVVGAAPAANTGDAASNPGSAASTSSAPNPPAAGSTPTTPASASSSSPPPVQSNGSAYYPYAGAQGAIATVMVASGVQAAPLDLVIPAPNYGGIGCAAPPAVGADPAHRASGFGLVARLNGNVLVFYGSPTVTSSTSSSDSMAFARKATLGEYPATSVVVARPNFFPSCKGIPAVSALGPWVAQPSNGLGPRYFWIDVGGVIVWQQISPESVTALLGNAAPKAATAAGAAPASSKAAAQKSSTKK